MLVEADHLNSSVSPSLDTKIPSNNMDFSIQESFSNLLELAANNDVEEFKREIQENPSSIDEIGLWYGRKKGSNQMLLKPRTPLMVAATYGSIDVLNLILSLSTSNVNRTCSPDMSTALHCAASSGSPNAVEACKHLLLAGADPNLTDANGRRPSDVIAVSPNLPNIKTSLEILLSGDSPALSSSPDNSSPSSSLSSSSNSLHSNSISEKKEYPIDPSLPDIKSSIYATDEFRMFSFKVRPCSRAYSHDWTECPFVHPGENARRRDPRKYHYSCVPCPEFREGACRRGDLCEFAHGVFESWLHPAQYRTRPCKDGAGCSRRVCFFAHSSDQLRPLYTSSVLPGSPSPAMNFQSSRLRLSLNARDLMPDFDIQEQMVQQQMLNDLSCFSPQAHLSLRSKSLAPSNLEELFAADFTSSPRFTDQVFSPSHKAAVFNQIQQQQQQQGMLSPINTNVFSPKASFGLSSPRSVEAMSPMNSRIAAFAHRGNQLQTRSLSSRELGSVSGASAANLWMKWGSPNGKVDWTVNDDELTRKFHRCSPFELGTGGEEPDVSWVQSLVKESPPDFKEKAAMVPTEDGMNQNLDSQVESGVDHTVLGGWLEQMQLDQLVA